MSNSALRKARKKNSSGLRFMTTGATPSIRTEPSVSGRVRSYSPTAIERVSLVICSVLIALRPLRPELDVDVLFAREEQHFLEALFAPYAGLLDASERRAQEVLADLVDPHEPGLHGHGRAVCGRDVVGPDRAGEAVFDGVDLGEHILLIAPFEDGQHW